jgi:hypothetical protein
MATVGFLMSSVDQWLPAGGLSPIRTHPRLLRGQSAVPLDALYRRLAGLDSIPSGDRTASAGLPISGGGSVPDGGPGDPTA